jgi:O-succinylbenzoic acid--CoA ligase
MVISEPLHLDFSLPNTLDTVRDLLKKCQKQDPFYASLLFCEEWLSGKKEFYFHTSGSTGKPQSMRVNRRRIVASIESTASFLDLKKEGMVFICLNTQFTGGKMLLARALHLGLQAEIVRPTNQPFRFLGNKSYVLTSFLPSQLFHLFQQNISFEFLSNIENIFIGGAPLHNELLEKLSKLEKCRVFETFGMTETLSHIALKNLNGRDGASSYFKKMPDIILQTNDASCLMVKGKVTANKWLETKDVVQLIDANHFIWKGRIDNVINSGGVKLYPEDIEQEIAPFFSKLGHAFDYFITSIPDKMLGECLVLVVEGKEFHTENLLKQFKQEFPAYHVPKKILFKPKFERTETGKVKRVI